MRKFRSFLIIVLVAVLAFSGCAQKAAAPASSAAPAAPAASNTPAAPSTPAPAEPINVKIGFAESPESKHIIGYRYMCDNITKATEGLVQFELYPSNSLGSERDLYEGCQLGTVDACIITNAVLTNFVPQAAVLDQPFLFNTYETAWGVIDGQLGDMLKAEAEKSGVKLMGYMDSGARCVFTTKPSTGLDDLKGRKIRTMENPYHMAAYNALGCIATPMASGDVFTALQQGTIDGAENTIPSIMANKFYEISKYICNQPMIFAFQPVVFSNKLWDKIPEEYHDAVLAVIADGCDYQRKLLRDSVDEFKTQLANEEGVTFFDIDLDKVKPLTTEAMKQFTFDAEYSKILADEIAKYEK